jgi:hypothetical protein
MEPNINGYVNKLWHEHARAKKERRAILACFRASDGIIYSAFYEREGGNTTRWFYEPAGEELKKKLEAMYSL